ncbi:MAG: hypothetical protein D6685_09420 [Bacteroidetes bacterium]|nr:MAG: hypothetical protein D6685_09420 [Bacteroidota bacterium]
MPSSRSSFLVALGAIGPGLAVAATGVGAGDVIAAAVSGATYGTAILWAAVVGAVIKGTLNEGIARWQLATGMTLLEGWGRHLHRAVLPGFAVYLVLWTFMVAGALMAACGLAAYALVPGLPVAAWGALHAVAAFVLVLVGRYALFERLMKGFIALMFVTVVSSALLVRPDWSAVVAGLAIPSVPDGAGPFLLGVIGGVGGSVTLLSYSYWIRERGWDGPAFLAQARLDLGAAYLLTGLFGVAIMVVAAGLEPGEATGTALALELARQIELVAGPAGRWIFLLGFWGAVFTSMLGVWQGVPYLFADVVHTLRRPAAPPEPAPSVRTDSPWYRAYLLFIAFPPMTLLLADRPVWVVLIYSIAGAFFMPFLAATLLYLNNRRTLPAHLRNGRIANVLLLIACLVFGYLCAAELAQRL